MLYQSHFWCDRIDGIDYKVGLRRVNQLSRRVGSDKLLQGFDVGPGVDVGDAALHHGHLVKSHG